MSVKTQISNVIRRNLKTKMWDFKESSFELGIIKSKTQTSNASATQQLQRRLLLLQTCHFGEDQREGCGSQFYMRLLQIATVKRTIIKLNISFMEQLVYMALLRSANIEGAASWKIELNILNASFQYKCYNYKPGPTHASRQRSYV